MKWSMSASVVLQPRLTRIVAVGDLGRDAHRRQHMARADLARRAGGAGADHDAVEIERDDLRLGRHARHRDRRGVRQARHVGADDDRIGRQRAMPASSAVAQPADALVIRETRCRSRGRRGEAGDAGDVLGAGAAAALLAAAAQQRRQIDARRTRPARRRPAGRRSCAPTESADRRRSRPCRAASCRPPGPRRNGRARPAHARMPRSRRPAGSRRSRCWRASPRPAPAVSSPASSSASAARSTRPLRSTGIRSASGHCPQHRIMLDRRDQHPLAAGAEQRQVVGLGAAAGEDDARGRRADQRRDRRRGRARSAARAARPQRCTEDGLPHGASAAATAAAASGRSGAVAFQSR